MTPEGRAKIDDSPGRLPQFKITAFVVLILGTLVAGGAAAAVDPGPDTVEPGSIEAIAAATTDPRFLSPWVAYLPDAPGVPSPRDFLGRIARRDILMAAVADEIGRAHV